MATYEQFTQEQFEAVVLPLGFVLMKLPGTTELVYGKVYRTGERLVSVRVYSSITQGEAREVGADAIRVEAWIKNRAGEPVRIGGSKRVNRVKGWASNLAKRLNEWADKVNTLGLAPQCPKCGGDMRPIAKGFKCVNGKSAKVDGQWVTTGCDGMVWE